MSTPTPNTTLPRPGDTVGDVVLGEEVGWWDGTVVFTASRAGAPAWLHLCTRTDQSYREQWRDAAVRLQSVRHPNVAEGQGLFEQAGHLGVWSVPPQGQPLPELLERGRLSLADVQSLGAQLLSAVAALHDAGVLVPGLDPAHLHVHHGQLVLAELPAPRPMLDAGTMAPELYTGQLPDVRSDLHAVGGVLALLATGEPAFAPGEPEVVRQLVASGRARRPRDLRSDVPEELDRAIMTALESDREHRTPDARTLLALWKGDNVDWDRPSGMLMMPATPPPAPRRATPVSPGRLDGPPAAPAVDVLVVPVPGSNGPPTLSLAQREAASEPAGPTAQPVGPLIAATPAAIQSSAVVASPAPADASSERRGIPWLPVAAAGLVVLLVLGGGALVVFGGGAALLAGGAADVATSAPAPRPPSPVASAPVPSSASPVGEPAPTDAAPVEVTAAVPGPGDAPGTVPEPQLPGTVPSPGPVAAAPGRPGPVPTPLPAPTEDAVAMVAEPAPAEPAPAEPAPVLATVAPTPSPAPVAAPVAVAAPAPTGPPVVHRSLVQFKLSPKSVYPEGQRDAGEVTCLATVVIDQKGLPQSVSVSRCPDAFAESTRTAVMKARFEPPMYEGVSSEVTTTLPIKFAPR
jgi:outer membrane biosynthesis protein TonB